MQPSAPTTASVSWPPDPANDTGPATGPPPLRPWSRVWRYLAAAGIALVAWLAVASDFVPMDGSPLTGEQEARVGGALLMDLLLGVLALCLLPLRRRHPVVTAVVTAALTTVSASAVGGALVATVSVATWRRWRWVVPVLTVWVLSTIGYEGWWRPTITGTAESTPMLLAGGLVIGIVATCVATGYYVGARRELIENLRQRAETAEREQTLKADAAREAERTRIAREMHDVLAHRISLVSMHAGALAYRSDLTREETTEAAGVIQHNANLALTELRQVLGVLRANTPRGDAEAPAEPPQPELAQLPELVAAAEPYVGVTVDATDLPEDGDLPATTSRTAYRVVQEALTNACKHAPGSAVTVRLAGAPGGLLTVEVVNGAPPARPGPRETTPGAGLGLVGLTERVGLAGGALEYGAGPDGSFAVRSWLPWEERE